MLASHEGVEEMGELVTSRQICLLPEGGAGGGGWTDWWVWEGTAEPDQSPQAHEGILGCQDPSGGPQSRVAFEKNVFLDA